MNAEVKLKPATTSAEVQTYEDDTIDLIELFFSLLSKWHMLLLFALIGMLLANAYAFFFIDPTYVSTAKLYVVSASGDSAVDLTDLNIGTSLTNDYQELIMSYPVLDKVIEALALDMSSDELKNMISLSNPTNTRVLTITVTTTDAELSMHIANTLAGVAQDYLPETMSTPRPNVAQVARTAERKAAPSYLKYTLLGGIVGVLIIGAWYVAQFLMDDTVHAAEDLEKAFGLSLLTSVPENEAMNLADNRKISDKRLRGKKK